MEVLLRHGWLDKAAMEEEQGHSRIETRLLRGLRMRTIRQRVQSIERIQRWAISSLGRPWPANVNEMEDYLEDLATDEKRGASSFARAKFGIIYAEAAANIPAEARIGDAPALRLCIQELTMRSSKTKWPRRKKQSNTSRPCSR